jgi:N-acetylmuramoyl-L-alanine amidase
LKPVSLQLTKLAETLARPGSGRVTSNAEAEPMIGTPKRMRKATITCLLSLLIAAIPVGAVVITTPSGTSEIFSRAELIDLVTVLKLAGAQVHFAPAAGSYVAVFESHEIQFTPGGTLAVVDGKLTPLPGPVRQLDGHVIGALGTANILLAPLGWSLHGSPEALTMARLGGDRIAVAVVRSEGTTSLIVSGTSQRPRVSGANGTISLLFPSAVELAAAIPHDGELLGGELRDNTLALKLASGIDVASTYPLEDPPRFIIRLAASQPVATVAASRGGTVIVLDPGHGGEDHGAKGPAGELEKDITLAIARMTAANLQASGLITRLTRDSDESANLVDRTSLANRLQATAFVSIHANASAVRGARGTETYFMSADASDPIAAQSAERENASAPPDTVQLILWDLAHAANLNSSARLARAIQERMNALQNLRDRGVRQAPFVVLTGAAMPAALVEVGFLSNPEEAVRLSTREGQDQVARALADAIAAFVHSPESVAATTPPAP